MLRRVGVDQLPVRRREAVDVGTLRAAGTIVEDVRARGEVALREHAERLGDLEPGAPMVVERPALDEALARLGEEQRALLERTVARIRSFSAAQREAIRDLDVAIPGGRAGHTLRPVDRAGCYAPGGRFPLPSSVLMTVVPARQAGVRTVWVASPRPAPVTLAAASLAGADALLAVGGAQAVAALAHGAGAVPACDVIVGPGNRWVTAAKRLVAGTVGIDMLAGPSELVVLADASVDPDLVAADLLAQAEHDPDAVPILVTTESTVADRVAERLHDGLRALPTAEVARAALANGLAVVVGSLDEALSVCDRLAPEHLSLHVERADGLAARLRHFGGLFVGAASAQVLGDYGCGPNHVLPTGGTARHRAGLSVMDFLRPQTWVRLDDPAGAAGLYDDAVSLARLEGLEAHARSAEVRRPSSKR